MWSSILSLGYIQYSTRAKFRLTLLTEPFCRGFRNLQNLCFRHITFFSNDLERNSADLNFLVLKAAKVERSEIRLLRSIKQSLDWFQFWIQSADWINSTLFYYPNHNYCVAETGYLADKAGTLGPS